MHEALQIHEIVSNILGHLRLHDPDPCAHRMQCYFGTSEEINRCDLASLARTCRAFKEPALDALWAVLSDLSPLAQCIPDASYRSEKVGTKQFLFRRPLTKTEWDILRSYACRIRSIRYFADGLDWESVVTFLNHPITEPLFPNLRTLSSVYAKTMPLLLLPFPSLLELDVRFPEEHLLRDPLESFSQHSPNIRELHVSVYPIETWPCKFENGYICRWQNLCSVSCLEVALDMDDLVHLSHMPALTQLGFALSATLPAFDSPLVLSNLSCLTLHSESLDLVSRFLPQTRLPAITSFGVRIDNRPSKAELSFFSAHLLAFNDEHAIMSLSLEQHVRTIHGQLEEHLSLDLEDLRPYMAFGKLRCLVFDVRWKVALTDQDVLALASAWPELEIFLINKACGWKSEGGITPGGIVQLLQSCRSLTQINVALDTRGYTEIPPGLTPRSLGLSLPCNFLLDVLDSAIEAESITAVAAFMYCIVRCIKSPRYFPFGFLYWQIKTLEFPQATTYPRRWADVAGRVNNALIETSRRVRRAA